MRAFSSDRRRPGKDIINLLLIWYFVCYGEMDRMFMVHWPARITDADLFHMPGHIVDIMSTCAAAARADYPEQG